MKGPWRVWVAFAIAPLLGSGISVAAFTAAFDSHANWSNFRGVFTFTCLIALGATFILAVPSYFILRRRRPVLLWHCAVAGLAIGAIGGGGLIGILDGLTTGCLSWVIAIWRNHDSHGSKFANTA